MPSSRVSSPDQHNPLPADLEFMQVLWSVDHALNVKSRGMIRRLGITGPQRFVIRLLGRTPGTRPGHLATLLRVHPGTVSGILRRLNARGLIARVADPHDGRKSRLQLTRKGVAFDVPDDDTVESAVGRVLRRMPRRHVEIAHRLLLALEEELSR